MGTLYSYRARLILGLCFFVIFQLVTHVSLHSQTCTIYMEEDFEQGLSVFSCTGDCNITMEESNSGDQGVVLNGGQNHGVLTTPMLESTGYDTVKISFLVYGDGQGATSYAALLQLSNDDGNSYNTIQTIAFGNSQLDNPVGRWVAYSICIPTDVFAPSTILRIVNGSSLFEQRIIIDDFKVSVCAVDCEAEIATIAGGITLADGRYKSIYVSAGAYVSEGVSAVLRAQDEVIFNPDFGVISQGGLQVEMINCN